MMLILTLLLIGVLSLLERLLLAAIQLRQGPTTAALHGFSQLLADGLKLYSKYPVDVASTPFVHVVTGSVFAIHCGITILVTCSSLLSALSSELDWIISFSLASAIGSLLLTPLVLTPSRYVSLGVLRQLRAAILADLVLVSGVLGILLVLQVLDTSAESASRTSIPPPLILLVALCIGPSVLILSGRAPFDLPEAESELVAGILTELGGVSFSF